MGKKVILYIAVSLDGFIARKDGSVDWLDKFNNTDEDFGYSEFYNSIGTVILGSTTFDQFPDAYNDKDCFVFSRKKTGKKGNAIYVSGDPEEFLKSLNTKDDMDIWLVGGANLTNQFLQHDLIDEFIITIIPTILGDGIRLFSEETKELQLIVKDTKSFDSGVVQIHYKRV